MILNRFVSITRNRVFLHRNSNGQGNYNLFDGIKQQIRHTKNRIRMRMQTQPTDRPDDDVYDGIGRKLCGIDEHARTRFFLWLKTQLTRMNEMDDAIYWNKTHNGVIQTLAIRHTDTPIRMHTHTPLPTIDEWSSAVCVHHDDININDEDPDTKRRIHQCSFVHVYSATHKIVLRNRGRRYYYYYNLLTTPYVKKRKKKQTEIHHRASDPIQVNTHTRTHAHTNSFQIPNMKWIAKEKRQKK